MTSNQIENRKAEEMARSNRAKEAETARHNKVTEKQETAKLVISGISTLKPGFRAKNDAAWYMLDKQLSTDVSQISFNTPLGYPVDDIAHVVGVKSNVAPGIMTIEFIPTIGNFNLSDIVAKNIYAYVRHANSGSRNYEASDLLMYIYAMDQAYSLHGALSRLYSLLLTSKSENRYYLDAMIRAAGFNPVDLRNHISDLRIAINSFAVRLNSFYCPKDMYLFQRHYWMNSTIFKDQPVKKSQVYMFVQKAYGRYDDVNGKLIFDVLPYKRYTDHAGATFSAITTAINSIINGLIQSEDAGIMAGDILKAYGESNMLFIPSIPEDFHIEAEYSEEVLSQITNTTLVGDIYSSFDITQILSGSNAGRIYQGEYLTQQTTAQTNLEGALNSNRYGILARFNSGHGVKSAKPVGCVNASADYVVCNFYKDNPSAADILVATRLTCLPEIVNTTTTDPIPVFRANAAEAADANTQWGYPVLTNGSEIATVATIYTLDKDTLQPTVATDFMSFQNAYDSNLGFGDIAVLLGVAKFDWAPVTHVLNMQATTSDVGTKYAASELSEKVPMNTRDYANYASVPAQSLSNMHYNSMLSELGIPLLGTKVRSR